MPQGLRKIPNNKSILYYLCYEAKQRQFDSVPEDDGARVGRVDDDGAGGRAAQQRALVAGQALVFAVAGQQLAELALLERMPEGEGKGEHVIVPSLCRSIIRTLASKVVSSPLEDANK